MQQKIAQLLGLAGQGQQATAGTAASGDNITQAIAQILGQQGQVRAGGILTRGGITSGQWQNAGAFADETVGAIMKALGIGF